MKNKNYVYAGIYLGIAAFMAIFGVIYEHFGHGVYSYFMICAFLWPLIGGTLVYLLLGIIKLSISSVAQCLWNAGIATFSLGFVYKGIIDIYGTNNRFPLVYWIVGGSLVSISVICGVGKWIRFERKNPV